MYYRIFAFTFTTRLTKWVNMPMYYNKYVFIYVTKSMEAVVELIPKIVVENIIRNPLKDYIKYASLQCILKVL